MTLTRLLMNLLLALALVASGPLPAFAADAAGAAQLQAPCHDFDGPSPAPAGDEADCCGGEPGYCGCDCLQHAAAAPMRTPRLAQPAPASFLPAMTAQAPPRRSGSPDTRPPIA